MKKMFSMLFFTVVLLIGCSPNEDSIQSKDLESKISELLQDKGFVDAMQPLLNSSSSRDNNGNGIIFTPDGDFFAIGLPTDIPGVIAFVYETGYWDIKIFPQENRLEVYLHTNNATGEIVDFNGDVPELLYTNYCIKKKGIVNIILQAEYFTYISDEGLLSYNFDFFSPYTSSTVGVNIRLNNAFVNDECVDPTVNKRLKVRAIASFNSNSDNSANFIVSTLSDD